MGNGTGNVETTLTEVADGCLAYLQGDGGWGWSNAGLVIGDGVSLLVDTLFDLKLTQRMLDAMGDHTRPAPIGTVVNTHANGDHCYGNQLVVDAQIVSSAATAAETNPAVEPVSEVMTEAAQAALTPDQVLAQLKEGNRRFVEGRLTPRDYNAQAAATAAGQYPKAAVLGCVDSRVPPEIIFDQGALAADWSTPPVN